MGLLRDVVVRVGGSVSPILQRAAQIDIDNLIRRCLHQAVEEWISDGLPSFDHTEASQTVQLYGRLDRATRTPGALYMLEVQLESVELTPEVLAGKASAVKLARPDLRFWIGGCSRTVECKLLATTGEFAKLYVEEGMVRFTSGKYSGEDSRATMVGYIQEGSEADVVDRINGFVSSHGDLDAGHELGPASSVSLRFKTRVSEHVRVARPTISLDHLLVDIR